MLLNHRYILLIACQLLFSKINLCLSVCFVVLLIIIFCVLLDVFFLFLRPYHAHKLDFCYSPFVFLGYNSSHLGYRCLDLASHHIYVSRHVHFCENIFPFVNSDTFTSTLPTACTPSTPESSLTLLAYHFTNWPKQHPCSALYHTPTDRPTCPLIVHPLHPHPTLPYCR